MTQSLRHLSALPDLPDLDAINLPIDAYIRVSRVGDRTGASYTSPGQQRQKLEAWGKSRGVQLVMHEPEENVSGGTMDRPIFNDIMRRIRSGESGGIAVYKLDRFARTVVGGMTTLRELTELGALFASVTEPLYDMTTADGRMVLQFNLMMAEYFRERMTETWDSSLTYAVGRGVHIAPGLPYGYSKNDDKILVPNPAAPFAHRAFELRAVDCLAFSRIAQWLDDHAPPRSDGRPWTASSVQRMISRRVYMGVAHWGAQENADAHPAIVDERLWHQAQRKVTTASPRRDPEDSALLHGVVRCAGCRFTMSRALNRSGGRDRQYYRCRGRRCSGQCGAPAAIRADHDGLEEFVESIVCAELDRRRGRFTSHEDTGDLPAALAELDAASADVEEFRQDSLAKRRLGKRWLSFLEPLLQAEEAAQARVNELRALHGTPFDGLTSHAYRLSSRSERARVLRAMIDVVFIRAAGARSGNRAVPFDDGRVRILWHGQGPDDLPSSNAASSVVAWPWPVLEGEAQSGVAV